MVKKNFGYRWKRCRRSLKDQRDARAFERAERVLDGLHELDRRGELEVFYFDESGVSLTPVVPYAWQPTGRTLELPGGSRRRVNLLGFMNRRNEMYSTMVEGSVDSQTVITAIDEFIAWRRRDVPAALVLDNAGIHTSAEVLERHNRWLAQGLILFYLPTYSPELNLIEIFWRKLKYEWLPFSAYLSFAALKQALVEILNNVGKKYQITFV